MSEPLEGKAALLWRAIDDARPGQVQEVAAGLTEEERKMLRRSLLPVIRQRMKDWDTFMDYRTPKAEQDALKPRLGNWLKGRDSSAVALRACRLAIAGLGTQREAEAALFGGRMPTVYWNPELPVEEQFWFRAGMVLLARADPWRDDALRRLLEHEDRFDFGTRARPCLEFGLHLIRTGVFPVEDLLPALSRLARQAGPEALDWEDPLCLRVVWAALESRDEPLLANVDYEERFTKPLLAAVQARERASHEPRLAGIDWEERSADPLSAGEFGRDALLDLVLRRLAESSRPVEANWWARLLEHLGPSDDDWLARRDAALDLVAAPSARVTALGLAAAKRLLAQGAVEPGELLPLLEAALGSETIGVARAALGLLRAAAQRDGACRADALVAALAALTHPKPAIQEVVFAWLESEAWWRQESAIVAAATDMAESIAPSGALRLRRILPAAGALRPAAVPGPATAAPVMEVPGPATAGTPARDGQRSAAAGTPAQAKAQPPAATPAHGVPPPTTATLAREVPLPATPAALPPGAVGPLRPVGCGQEEAQPPEPARSPAPAGAGAPAAAAALPDPARLRGVVAGLVQAEPDAGRREWLAACLAALEGRGPVPDPLVEEEAWRQDPPLDLPRTAEETARLMLRPEVQAGHRPTLERVLAGVRRALTDAERPDIARLLDPVKGHPVLAALARAWITPRQAIPIEDAVGDLPRHQRIPYYSYCRIGAALEALARGDHEIPLCTPTHATGWLDPEVLADRLCRRKRIAGHEVVEVSSALYRLAPGRGARERAWQRVKPAAGRFGRRIGGALTVALAPPDEAARALPLLSVLACAAPLPQWLRLLTAAARCRYGTESAPALMSAAEKLLHQSTEVYPDLPLERNVLVQDFDTVAFDFPLGASRLVQSALTEVDAGAKDAWMTDLWRQHALAPALRFAQRGDVRLRHLLPEVLAACQHDNAPAREAASELLLLGLRDGRLCAGDLVPQVTAALTEPARKTRRLIAALERLAGDAPALLEIAACCAEGAVAAGVGGLSGADRVAMLEALLSWRSAAGRGVEDPEALAALKRAAEERKSNRTVQLARQLVQLPPAPAGTPIGRQVYLAHDVAVMLQKWGNGFMGPWGNGSMRP